MRIHIKSQTRLHMPVIPELEDKHEQISTAFKSASLDHNIPFSKIP